MDTVKFVQNVKYYCAKRGVKPTNACRESGAGKSLIDQMERRGSIPSVEKVQMLAQYLGVTVSELLGETIGPPPDTVTLHDSAVVLQPTDVKRLTVGEVEMIMAYRSASPEIRRVIDGALEPYREKDSAGSAG